MTVDNLDDETRQALDALKAAARVGYATSVGELLGRGRPPTSTARPSSGVEDDEMVKAWRAARRWHLGELTVREPGPTDYRPIYLPRHMASAWDARDGAPRIAWWYAVDERRVVALTVNGAVFLLTETVAGVDIQPMRRPEVDQESAS